MSDLPPAALQFLQQHLNYDARNFLTKKKLRGQMEKFWRRREKALAELKILPPDHPRHAEFTNGIKTATDMAETGDLKGGYAALDAVKLATRVEANTVKNGLDLNTALADLVPLEAKTQQVGDIDRDAKANVLRDASRLELYASMVEIASEAGSREEAITRSGNAMAAQKEMLERVDALSVRARQYQDAYKTAFEAAPAVKATTDRLEHNLGLLRADGKVPGGIEGRYMTVVQRTVELGLTGRVSAFNNVLNDRISKCKTAVKDTCAEAIRLTDMEIFHSTDNQGEALTAEEETDRLGDVFKKLEEREEARIEEARKRIRDEANWDMYLERNPVAATPITPSRVDTFATGDVLDTAALGFDPLDRAVDPDTFAQAAGDRLETLLQADIDAYRNSDPANGAKVPDEVLEVASRTLESWYEDVAKSLGLVWDEDNLTQPFIDKIKAGAEAMQKKAIEIYPDKAAPDMSSFTMGGVVYDDVKKLGQGGGGAVYLATGPNGEKLVIKKPLAMDKLGKGDSTDPCIDEMRREILAQRAITGGEDGVCPDNLLEHKGMVMSAEGIPLPVMDLADAGDANEFNTSMSALSGAGLISESARQALMATQMQDVLKGVKAMHDQGFGHFDLKELNVFMTKDGTFKVADFGLAQEADSRDEALTDMFETTEIYKAPEVDGADDLTMKGDMFSLGEMMKRGLSTEQNYGLAQEKFGYMRGGSTARKDEDGKDVDVSASTRLIAKLMSENADDRPSIETALESSYFNEIDHGHSPEQIDRLRKAAAEYAATVGRKTKDLEQKEMICRATITENQRKISGETTRDLIRAAENFLQRAPDIVERLRAELAIETDDARRSSMEDAIRRNEGAITKTTENIVKYRAKLEEDVPERDVQRAKQEIEKNEAQAKGLRAQISEIRDDPKYADILTELEEANKAFR